MAPPEAKLADAQLALARSYQAPSWLRLVKASCVAGEGFLHDDGGDGLDVVAPNCNRSVCMP